MSGLTLLSPLKCGFGMIRAKYCMRQSYDFGLSNSLVYSIHAHTQYQTGAVSSYMNFLSKRVLFFQDSSFPGKIYRLLLVLGCIEGWTLVDGRIPELEAKLSHEALCCYSNGFVKLRSGEVNIFNVKKGRICPIAMSKGRRNTAYFWGNDVNVTKPRI